MSKLLPALLVALCLTLGMNISSPAESPSSPADEAPVEFTKTPPRLGGWQVNLEADSDVPDDLREIIAACFPSSPVTVLAAATEDRFAVLVNSAEEDPDGWGILTLRGSECLGYRPLSVTVYETAEENPLAGDADGWMIRTRTEGLRLPESANRVFQEAMEEAGRTGSEALLPVALLGTQVVAGTNYRILCAGGDALYIATVWARTGDRTAELTSLEMLNLPPYLSD